LGIHSATRWLLKTKPPRPVTLAALQAKGKTSICCVYNATENIRQLFLTRNAPPQPILPLSRKEVIVFKDVFLEVFREAALQGEHPRNSISAAHRDIAPMELGPNAHTASSSEFVLISGFLHSSCLEAPEMIPGPFCT